MRLSWVPWVWTPMGHWSHQLLSAAQLSRYSALMAAKPCRRWDVVPVTLSYRISFSIQPCTSSPAPLIRPQYTCSKSRMPSRSALSYASMVSHRQMLIATPMERTKSRGKWHIFTLNLTMFVFARRATYRLSVLKVMFKYFDSDLCLAKIKVDERFKTIAFDERNRRLTVMSQDRVLYFFDIP